MYAEAEIKEVQGDWKRYSFELRPRRTDPHARLAILFEGGRGRVWVDQVSLLPGDAVGGVRADVEALVAALRPAFLRWPGGNVAQDYHWAWGVGPRDRRPIWTNLSWKNEPEPGDIGTDEFIAFCRRVGAEPSITVNVEGRGATAEEAAAWVEYCNGPATSRYGAMRAANGHPEPYRVKYWELGNEIWGDWVRGHSDALTYARNYLRYHEAMRAVDSTIQFIAVGDNDMSWNRTVLRTAGGAIDYLAIHHYYGRKEMAGDARNLMARPLYYERFYRDVEKVIREEAPGRPIRLHINEWGLDLPEARQHSMEAALYGARLMNVFERTSPLVAMSAESDLVNGWPGGIIQAGRHGVFVTPTYYVNLLYNEHRGRDRLKTTVEGPDVRHQPRGHRRPGPRRGGQPVRRRLRALRQGGQHRADERRHHPDRPARRRRRGGSGLARDHAPTAWRRPTASPRPMRFAPVVEVIPAGGRFQVVAASAFRVRHRPAGHPLERSLPMRHSARWVAITAGSRRRRRPGRGPSSGGSRRPPARHPATTRCSRCPSPRCTSTTRSGCRASRSIGR